MHPCSFIPSLFLSISQTLVYTTRQTRTCRRLPRTEGGVTTRRPLPQTVGGVQPHEPATCRPQQISRRVNSPPTCNTQRHHHQGEPHTVQSESPPGEPHTVQSKSPSEGVRLQCVNAISTHFTLVFLFYDYNFTGEKKTVIFCCERIPEFLVVTIGTFRSK